MADLNTSVALNLTGNLRRRARQFERSVQRFSRRSDRHFRSVGRAARWMGRGLDRAGNRWTALATGVGGGMVLRNMVRFDARLTRLGTNANISAENIDHLRGRLFEVAQDPNIRLDPDQILQGVEEVVGRVGDIEFAMNNLSTIAQLIQATGTEGRGIGGILAELQKMDVTAPQEVAQAMAVLAEQGKTGAVPLEQMARFAPRVLQSYTSLGRRGPEAIREFGAAFQTAMRGTANVELAATSFERMLAELGDPQKLEQLQSVGIQVFDPDALEEGRRVLRPINQLMTEIVEKAEGDRTRIASIFGQESIRAFNNLITEYNSDEGIRSLEEFMNVQADASTITEDSARNAATMESALQSLRTAFERFADSELAEPIQDLADAINSIDPDTLNRIMKGLGYGAAGFAGLIVLSKAIRAGSTIFGGARRLMGGGRGRGGLGGGIAGSGVVPVYVVNWGSRRGRRRGSRRGRRNGQRRGRPGRTGGRGGGSTGGAAGSTGRRGRRGGRARRLGGRVREAARRGGSRTGNIARQTGRASRSLGRAAVRTGARAAPWVMRASPHLAAGTLSFGAGYGAGTLINDHLIDETALGNAIGRSLTHTMAFLGNDQAQATIAGLRARERRAAEESARATLEIMRTQQGRDPQQGLSGTLRIHVDSEGRPRIREVRREGALDFDVDAGMSGS